jgi:micrococcal nuclease
VSSAIDGDTLKLSTGEYVRLIGVDTPESRYNNKLVRDCKRSRRDKDAILKMGREASNFTRKLVEGKRVKLAFDLQKHDKYGRLLAYVYLEDGTFVNGKIVEEGYAKVMTIPPNVKYAKTFLMLEREARQKGSGLWQGAVDKSLF